MTTVISLSVLFPFLSIGFAFFFSIMLSIWQILLDRNSLDRLIQMMNIYDLFTQNQKVSFRNSIEVEWIWLRRTRPLCHCYKINKHKWQIDVMPVNVGEIRRMYEMVHVYTYHSTMWEMKYQKIVTNSGCVFVTQSGCT